MMTYIEEFLGLAEGSLSNSDFGIMLGFLLMFGLILVFIKLLQLWFDKIFM